MNTNKHNGHPTHEKISNSNNLQMLFVFTSSRALLWFLLVVAIDYCYRLLLLLGGFPLCLFVMLRKLTCHQQGVTTETKYLHIVCGCKHKKKILSSENKVLGGQVHMCTCVYVYVCTCVYVFVCVCEESAYT